MCTWPLILVYCPIDTSLKEKKHNAMLGIVLELFISVNSVISVIKMVIMIVVMIIVKTLSRLLSQLMLR